MLHKQKRTNKGRKAFHGEQNELELNHEIMLYIEPDGKQCLAFLCKCFSFAHKQITTQFAAAFELNAFRRDGIL